MLAASVHADRWQSRFAAFRHHGACPGGLTPMRFENARWHDVRLRVTRPRVEAWIDDAKVIDLDAAVHKPRPWGILRPLRPLGLASFGPISAFRDIQYRRLRSSSDRPVGVDAKLWAKWQAIRDVAEPGLTPSTAKRLIQMARAFRKEQGTTKLFRQVNDEFNALLSRAEAVHAGRVLDFSFEGSVEGWHVKRHIEQLSARDGALCGRIAGDDPHVVRDGLRVACDNVPAILLRMRVTVGKVGTFFWTTQADPQWHWNKRLSFDVTADGEYHDYGLPVGRHPKWAGQTITGIRVDPVGDAESAKKGGEFAIDYIRGVARQDKTK